MKKIILTAGILMVTLITACGGEKESKVEYNDNVNDIRVEEIRVEEIKVEEILSESPKVECIDSEYNENVAYNSIENNWILY